MASELSRFLGEQDNGNKKTFTYAYATRQQRRKAIQTMIEQIGTILDAEQQYQDNIPPNLESSRMYEAAEHAVTALEEAMDILAEAY